MLNTLNNFRGPSKSVFNYANPNQEPIDLKSIGMRDTRFYFNLEDKEPIN